MRPEITRDGEREANVCQVTLKQAYPVAASPFPDRRGFGGRRGDGEQGREDRKCSKGAIAERARRWNATNYPPLSAPTGLAVGLALKEFALRLK